MAWNASSGGKGNVDVIYEQIEIDVGDKSSGMVLASLNEQLHTKEGLDIYQYSSQYTSCIYIDGDFSKSHEMALSNRDNSEKLKYNLFNMNCVQSVADVVLASLDAATDANKDFFDKLMKIREKVKLFDFKTWIPKDMHNALK